MRMLVRREHSTLELKQKLSAKGFDSDLVDCTISKLTQENKQSDSRFSEDFIRMRFNQGKGPIKIAIELKQRGINTSDFSEFDFYTLAKNIRQIKFGCGFPSDFNETAKQKRFLQSRGFDFEHIKYAFTE